MNHPVSWNRRVWPILALVAITVLALAGVILAGNQDNDGVSSTAAALGPGFVFQGQLADDGGAPLDGACDLRFGLYDEALDGSKLGEATRNGVTVVGGVFAVNLAFDPKLFSGDARWLQMEVRCPAGTGTFVSMPDRHELSAVPYALSLRPGARIQGSVPYGTSAEAGLKVYNSSTSSPIGLYGIVNAPAGPAIGVAGNNSSPDGFAVYGYSAPNGTGVRGQATTGAGVWGSSADWIGAYGYSANYVGVMGESPNSGGVFGNSTNGRGVSGESVNEHGVYGSSTNGAGVAGNSTAWIGVYGQSTNQVGVVGESSGHDGVRGVTTAANRVGVRGTAGASGSVGVWGESAVGTGVYGQSGAANGAALWGRNTAGGIALKAEGNVVQSLEMNGLPKAMLLVNGTDSPGNYTDSPIITRCFNGVSGSTTNGCGFTVSYIERGDDSISMIDFGFPVEGRYIVADFQHDGGIDDGKAFYIRKVSGQQVTLQNWYRECPPAPAFCGGGEMDYTIIVY